MFLYVIYAIVLLIVCFTFALLIRQIRGSANIGDDIRSDKYDVFAISDRKLTVLSGIPVGYDIDDIAEISFSVLERSMRCGGIMTVLKRNEKKGRRYPFDTSAYYKKLISPGKKEDFEKTIAYLMEELREHGIYCTKKS